jgi:2-C-methyl-D-erythritol 4-phosphate cytidylyltransferase
VGGGRGSRFCGDKLAEKIGDRTVFERSLGALRRAFGTAPLIAVVGGHSLEQWRERLGRGFPDVECLPGGDRRQDSVRLGALRAAEHGADVVAIHDAARALVDPHDVKEVVSELDAADGSVLCARVTDTIKRVDGDGRVLETVPRDDLRLAQTPQVFRMSALRRAWDEADQAIEWTDEASMLESIGLSVRSVIARNPNPKLTTDQDLVLMRLLAGSTR